MAGYDSTLTVPGSPERTLAYMADFSNAAAWDPGVASVERLDAGPVAVGSRFRVKVRFAGSTLPLDYAIRLLADARLVLEAETPTLHSLDEIRVAPHGTGTRLVYEARLELRGAWSRLDPLLQQAFDRIGLSAACGLARALDASEQTSGRDPEHGLRTSIEVDAPVEAAWGLLTDTRAWVRWGPSVRAVDCARAHIAPGTRGRVQTAPGVWLPFEVTRLTARDWSWRVGGVPATSHRVIPLPEKRCRIEIGVPRWAAPYLIVCRAALRRIAAELGPAG